MKTLPIIIVLLIEPDSPIEASNSTIKRDIEGRQSICWLKIMLYIVVKMLYNYKCLSFRM